MKSIYKIAIFAVLAGLGLYATSFFLSEQENNESSAFNFEEGEENEEQKRINAEERWKAEFEMIKNPITGRIPKGIRAKELNAAFRVPQFELDAGNYPSRVLPAIAITGRGPNNYGGRTRALGFDVRDTDIVISGGVTSGIYRSTNGGSSWARVTPAGEIHSLTCVAQDTRVGHRDTWYASTGERNSSAGGPAPGTGDNYYGYGIYKSTDNGLTWTAIANTQSNLEVLNSQFDYIHRMVVDPNNGNVLAATANIVSHLDISTGTWSPVLGSFATDDYVDIIYNAVGNKFYAAIYGRDGSGGIHSSTNGTTWASVGTPADLNPTGASGFAYDVERIVLANVANTEDVIAFFQLTTNYGFTCTNGATTEAGLAFYDVSADSWTVHTDKVGNCSNNTTATALPKQLELQEGYNMAITTKPNDANIVYLGGTEGYRYNLSTNLYEFIGGSQKAANSVNLHVDQHIFMFEPGSNDIMWSGSDGGLRKTDVTGTITATAGNHDNGYVWTDRNTDYNGYQYYGIDIDPATGSNFIAAGAQDNAFTIQPTGAAALEVGPTADGVDVAVISGGSDFTTHNIFLMWQNGSMLRYENGSEATGTINPASTDFVGRFYLDADNTNYMYFPSNTGTLHRTRIAESIAATTTTGNSATGWESMTGVSTAVGSDEISALDASRNIQYSNAAYSASNANRKLYFGTKNGKFFRLDDPAFAAAATVPVNITPPTVASFSFVSDVAVNPMDDKEILVTFSNYGINSVYHTSDASVASPVWTNVEGASGSAVELASARCAMITVENGVTIYMVGTSTGLYATDALSGSTTSWTRLGTNADLGLAVCVEMRLRPADNTIVLGTHGNGAFTLKFPTPLPVELVSFTGEAIDKGNQLNWETANEFNNKGFEIEKSNNAKDFETIGFVEGNGTSTATHNYELLDEFAERGISYYRLKQIDFDENFQFSEIVTIDNKVIEDRKQFKMYPNPIVDYVTVENAEGIVTVHNATGKLIKRFIINSDKQQVNLSFLSKGTYLLRFETEGGQAFTRKIVK